MTYTPSRVRVLPYVMSSLGAVFFAVVFAPPAGAAFLFAASALALTRAGAFERLHPDGNNLVYSTLFGASTLLVVAAGFFAFNSTTTVLAVTGVIGTLAIAYGIIRVTKREFPDELLQTETA